MLDRAKRLRNGSTPFGARLWRHFSRSQLRGYKFRPQHVIGNCIADSFCPPKGLIVKVDGDTHDPGRDAVRDATNLQFGYRTIRFSNGDVGKNIEGVLAAILIRLESLPDRWPHPSIPSPKGVGK